MYNTVNITGTNVWTNDSGETVTVTLTPLAFYFDMASNVKINPLPVTTASDANGNWTLADVPDPTPNGSGIPWKLVVQDKISGTTLYSQDVQPAFSHGTSQHWLTLTLPNAGVTTDGGPQGQPGPAGPTGPVGAQAWPTRPTQLGRPAPPQARPTRPRRPRRPSRPSRPRRQARPRRPQRARAERPVPRGRPAWSR